MGRFVSFRLTVELLWFQFLVDSTPSSWTENSLELLLAALRQCCRLKDLELGQRIHSTSRSNDIFVENTLVNMYSKCGNIDQARSVFDQMKRKDVVTWNIMILGLVENGSSAAALKVLNIMDCAPSHVTYVSALKACTGCYIDRPSQREDILRKCIALHEEIKAQGFDSMAVVANTLLDTYMKLGDCSSAQKIFQSFLCKDVITWTCMILGYVENGECLLALETFKVMECRPDRVTYVAALKACAGIARENESLKSQMLAQTIEIHSQMRRHAVDSDVSVATCLVDTYRRCGNMSLARMTFDGMLRKTVVAWTCLIMGHADAGELETALEVFESMDCEPDEITYAAAMKACTSLERATSIHERVKSSCMDSRILVANSLIAMYSKLGELKRAREVFLSMKSKDVVTWNSVISVYEENGEYRSALDHFLTMDCEPDIITYTSVVKACTGLAREGIPEKETALEFGMAIHEQLKVKGLETDVPVASALIVMYGKCGSMRLARDTFDAIENGKQVVAWNCLLLGYVENGENREALELFSCMNCQPSHVTLIAVLKACIGLLSDSPSEREFVLHKGIAIEKLAGDFGFESDGSVSSALIDLYGKCGEMKRSKRVFDGMVSKDTVAWTCLINGYVDNEEGWTALEMFNRMEMCCEPNHATYVGALRACRDLAALTPGRRIHGRACRLGLEQNLSVANALVDFYGRCGCMEIALEIFNGMSSPGIVSWNTLMKGYSSHGDYGHVFHLANMIQEAGLRMDAVTLICILTTCSHSGMVEEGRMYFDSLKRYGVSPSVEHYTCMVDTLIRASKFEEAVSIVEKMPKEPDEITWKALLSACSRSNKRKAAGVAFDRILSSGNKTHAAAACVLMSHLCKGSERSFQEESEFPGEDDPCLRLAS